MRLPVPESLVSDRGRDSGFVTTPPFARTHHLVYDVFDSAYARQLNGTR